MRRRCVSITCAALLLLVPPAHAAPPAADVAQAGVAAYEDGRMAEAGALFERAARAGNRLAQFNYAMMLYRGEAPAQEVANDAAWGWLRRAAGAGLPQAQYVLAQLYDHGNGVPRSLTTAEEWYRRAAEQGHVEAQIALATMYFVGTPVAAPDYEKAARWYLAAARAGEPGAQFLVADMYDKGYGLPHDKRLAAHWYRVAARQGDPIAAARLAALGADATDAPDAGEAKPGAIPAPPSTR
ncbi:MAG: sel1 repeat family protein [Proteobacteria bacterium]|nr:sel1 repeat family protein [Pseudomonadota bacterium]